jgi:hypothetical protein
MEEQRYGTHTNRRRWRTTTDNDTNPPVLSEPDEAAESGRGLFLVSMLAKQWSYYFPEVGGKVVWCQVEQD